MRRCRSIVRAAALLCGLAAGGVPGAAHLLDHHHHDDGAAFHYAAPSDSPTARLAAASHDHHLAPLLAPARAGSLDATALPPIVEPTIPGARTTRSTPPDARRLGAGRTHDPPPRSRAPPAA